MVEVFESFAHVPLDPIGVDGDDSLIPSAHGIEHAPPPPREMLANVVRTLVVPYVYLKANSSGPAVVSLARALWRAELLYKAPGVPFTPLLGFAKQRALIAFKREHHLPATAVYDRSTHRALAPYYDSLALGILHAVATPPQSPEDKIRLAKLAAGNWLYNNRIAEPYTQRRPWHVTQIPREPFGLDCSGGEAWCDYNAGGIPEPSGFPSWGFGNTTSQLSRYQRLGRAHSPTASRIAAAKIGDPIYYQGHVAWIISTGTTPRVWSFGSYPISLHEWNYRHDAVAICDLLP